MSIASAISNAQQRVADAYTAISNKGGTLPATQNLTNMPTAINSIPTGASSKFGLTIDNFIGDIDSNNKLKAPPNFSDITFTGVVDLNLKALYGRFYGASFSNNTTVLFPNLTSISGVSSLNSAFAYSSIKAFSCPNLTTISGTSCCGSAFLWCSSLTSVNLSSLTTISGNGGCQNMFDSCTYLPGVDFASLTTIQNSATFSGTFNNCYRLTFLSFGALTTTSFGSTYTNQFSGMFNVNTATTSGGCTVHFPSNLSSTISGLTGYPTFGGNSSYITLAFDLEATS